MTPLNRTSRTLPVLALAVAVGAGGGAGAAVAALHGNGSTTTRTVTAAAAAASPVATKTGALTVDQIYSAAKQGVVDITVTENTSSGPFGSGAASQAEGSGFVIDKQGDIVTNDHVVSGASSIKVKFADGTSASAKLVGSDPSTDIAVVRVSVPASELQPLSFGDSSAAQVGDGVVAIGSPFGLAGSVTTGVVSALNRTMQAPNHYTITGAIQTDAAINHGNSGGPLLDSSGKVIGVNAQIESDSGGSDGVGFAIPSNTVSKVAKDLAGGGTVSHAYLGVQLSGTSSATVAAVRSGSPAASAGLRQGDVITAIDGRSVGSADALVSAIDAHAPGDQVTLAIRRGGQASTKQLKLGTQPT
jgi:putative serine protease PepD